MKSIVKLFEAIASLLEKIFAPLCPSNANSPQIKTKAKGNDITNIIEVKTIEIHIDSLTVIMNGNRPTNESNIIATDRVGEQKCIDIR